VSVWVEDTHLRNYSFRKPLGSSPSATGARLGTASSDLPQHAASSERASVEPARRSAFGREIDPVRVLVWSLFGVLVLAVWAGIVWIIWKAVE
jgi:hypothetical protein